MSSSAESRSSAARARLLEALGARLEKIESLTGEMRESLRRADPAGIEGCAARLETLVQEFKVLCEEYRRLPATSEEQRSAEWAAARKRFDDAAVRVARSAAVGGGLLQRLIAMSRGLIGINPGESGDAYLANGQSREPQARGLRLREMA